MICYASRNLKGAEKQYGITEKECLAVLWCIKQFHHYVYGTKFTIITDHSALLWLDKIRTTSDRLARWSLFLQSYDYEIIHRKGKIHVNVDALSRPNIVMNSFGIFNTEVDSSLKLIDRYENEGLIHYLKYKNHLNGLSIKQMKLTNKLEKSYKLIIDNNGNDQLWFVKENDKCLAPKIQDRENIIQKAHMLGHFGVDSTIKRIRENYYWPRMATQVKEIVERCKICSRHNSEKIIEHPAKCLKISIIFERIGIDLIFGLPETNDGYKGILVITEYLTKYPFVKAIKSKTASEIAINLMEYISIFGSPKIILSDMGAKFVNSVIDYLLNGLGIERRVTSGYHPRTNGLTERFNQTLIQMLRKTTEENKLDWPKWLPFVAMAYRSRIHSTTKFTPFELMFGRKMNNFNTIEESIFKENNKTEIEDLSDRSKEIRQLVDNVHNKALNNIEIGQKTQLNTQNKNTSIEEHRIPIDSNVYIMTKGLNNKLFDKYKGPFKVFKHAKGGNYILKNV